MSTFTGRVVAASQRGDVGDSHESVTKFVFENGGCYDSYLATEPGRESFWAKQRRGLISYIQRGKFVFVGGGLIAPQQHKLSLLQEFLEYARRRGWQVMFHSIGELDLPAFRELGFEVTKLGEEAFVDVDDGLWSGKRFEWVRRQSNYCSRNGVRVEEILPHAMPSLEWEGLLAEILDVAAQTLTVKPQAKEMNFFEGHIDNHALGLRRLFVARSEHGAGRVEGFVVCNPMRGGRQWALELYRHRTDSIRGTIPFLFHEIINQFRDEGIRFVSLSLVPGLRCDAALPGDSPWIRRGLAIASQYLNLIFDMRGLAHFKSRFRPRYANRFTCSYPKATPRALFEFVRLFGVFHLDYIKLIKIAADRWFKLDARKTLADLSTSELTPAEPLVELGQSDKRLPFTRASGATAARKDTLSDKAA